MKHFLLGILVSFGLLLPSAHAQDTNLNIVFIPKSSDTAFWKFMRQGCDRAVREAGYINFTWRGPAYENDVDSQIRIVNAYTRPEVNAMIVVPTDRERLLEPLQKAASLGIKIIVVDSGLAGDIHRSFITTDNTAGGKLAAKRVVELLQGSGKVLILRSVAGSASTDERGDGFVEYIKANAPKISIVADEYGGGSKGKVQAATMKLLKQYANLSAIFAVNEGSTDGVLRALRTTGLVGKIKLVGFDTSDFLLEGLEKREISGLVVQNPQLMGYMGVKAAIDAIKQLPVKEKTLFTEAKMVTPENFRSTEIQELLFP